MNLYQLADVVSVGEAHDYQYQGILIRLREVGQEKFLSYSDVINHPYVEGRVWVRLDNKGNLNDVIC